MNTRVEHIIQRARERYGIVLTVSEVFDLDHTLERHDGGEDQSGVKFIGTLDDGSLRFSISLKGKKLRVSYNPRTHLTETILPDSESSAGHFKLGQALGRWHQERRRK